MNNKKPIRLIDGEEYVYLFKKSGDTTPFPVLRLSRAKRERCTHKWLPVEGQQTDQVRGWRYGCELCGHLCR